MLLPAVLAKREAKRLGATEALLVGGDGDVNEGASSNLFIVEGGSLVTPAEIDAFTFTAGAGDKVLVPVFLNGMGPYSFILDLAVRRPVVSSARVPPDSSSFHHARKAE